MGPKAAISRQMSPDSHKNAPFADPDRVIDPEHTGNTGTIDHGGICRPLTVYPKGRFGNSSAPLQGFSSPAVLIVVLLINVTMSATKMIFLSMGIAYRLRVVCSI